MTRRTIGENPLDALVPPKEEPKVSRKRETPAGRLEPERKAAAKERLTVHLPPDTIDRAKNAVYWSPGLTLAGLAETAFLKALEKLEKENGGPFPARTAELKGGRPMK